MSDSPSAPNQTEQDEHPGRWPRLSIRWRLTVWYSGSLCLLLIGFSTLVWAMTNSWLLAQTDAELIEELAELLDSINSSDDQASLEKNVAVWSQLHEPYGFDFELRTSDGKLLMQSERLEQADASLHTGLVTIDATHDSNISGLGELRIKAIAVSIFDERRRLWIAVSQAEQQRLLNQLLNVLITAGLVVMVGAGVGGYFLSRRVLRPVYEITDTAARISASGLDARIPVENPHDELGRLARTLNTMLDRLDQSFAELKRFTADAAHELRTPLTLLRNELEVCLRKSRSASDYEVTVRSALDDTQRMCRLAEQLLELARGDASSQPIELESVPLAALLTDVVTQLASKASLKGVTIELDDSLKWTESDDDIGQQSLTSNVAIAGDCSRLRRLFFNLLDNAVKYTPPEGNVQIKAETTGTDVIIIIKDSGCGIAPEHLPHIFDRFYRIDDSRATTTGGTGLGLAICRNIVDAHGGTIDITSQPGQGTQITIELRVFRA